MKKILITGANSYIGMSFENYMKQFDGYEIDTVDMIDAGWINKSFSEYDAVFHVAGIAHRKETEENKHLYYEVNRDLAVETAEKAKKSGVKQFILLSSMSVFGILEGKINKHTLPMPDTNYGKSKLEADNIISAMADMNFKVCILRPPMVYGKNCKGNFQTLKKFAEKSFLFPYCENKRSMIFIDNLCEFVKIVSDNELTGILYPQNKEYVCTKDIIKIISPDIKLIKGFGFIIKACSRLNIIKKVFGDLVYEQVMSDIGIDYSVVGFEESIKRSI